METLTEIPGQLALFDPDQPPAKPVPVTPEQGLRWVARCRVLLTVKRKEIVSWLRV